MGYSMYRILAYNSKLKKKRLKRIFHSTLVNPGRFIYERCGIGYQGRIEKIQHILQQKIQTFCVARGMEETKIGYRPMPCTKCQLHSKITILALNSRLLASKIIDKKFLNFNTFAEFIVIRKINKNKSISKRSAYKYTVIDYLYIFFFLFFLSNISSFTYRNNIKCHLKFKYNNYTTVCKKSNCTVNSFDHNSKGITLA